MSGEGPRPRTVWPYFWGGTLIGAAAGGVVGGIGFLDQSRRPDEICGHVFDIIIPIFCGAVGASGGAFVGALAGALVRGGVAAAAWVLAAAGSLAVVGWLFLRDSEEGIDRIAFLSTVLLACPGVLGLVAAWAVGRSEARRTGREV